MPPARFFRLLPWSVLLLAAGCGKNPPSAPPEQNTTAPKVTGSSIEFSAHNPQLGSLSTIQPRAVQQNGDLFTGRVTWNEDYTDRVFSPVAGQVEKVVAEIGQTVKKGDDLAQMHSADYGQAQADYRKALGDYAQFDKALARAKTLKEHGAAAQKDVESAQADFDRGLAEKERAEASLQLLGTTSGNFNDVYHVTSPIAGVVVDKNINVGQQLRADLILANTPQATAPLFVITDPTKLWVQLDVPEGRLGKLHVGDPVELRSPAYPGRTFPGKLASVGAFLDPQTRVAHARVEVENPDGQLKGEMYVSVEVKEAADAQTDVALPAQAVIYEDGKYYVFVQDAVNRFTRRPVTLEREAGPDGAQVVVRGLSPDQNVVTQGSLLINDVLAEASGDTAAAQPAAVKPMPANGDPVAPGTTPRPL